jgi:hypothetical protein
MEFKYHSFLANRSVNDAEKIFKQRLSISISSMPRVSIQEFLLEMKVSSHMQCLAIKP